MCIGARSTGSMNNHLHPPPTFLSTVNCGLVFHIKYWHVTFEVGQLENVAFYFQEFEIYYRFEFFGHNLPCVCAWKFFDRPTRWNTQKGQFDWAETKYKADNRKNKCVYSISSWLIGWCNRAEKTLDPPAPPLYRRVLCAVLHIIQNRPSFFLLLRVSRKEFRRRPMAAAAKELCVCEKEEEEYIFRSL